MTMAISPQRRATGLDGAVAAARPISLPEINSVAGLMTRVDRKYFVPRDLLAGLIEANPGLRVLQIGQERVHRYWSTYFDTPDFTFFRQHAQGRRQRYKVRVRTYATGDSFLEVKSKGYRGQTVKERIPHRGSAIDLGPQGRHLLAGAGLGDLTAALVPVVQTRYDRITLTQGQDRITCDLDLACIAGRVEFAGPQAALVETKTASGRSFFDRELARLGIRPHSVSKYCIGAGLHYPGLPANRWRRTIRRHFTAAPIGTSTPC